MVTSRTVTETVALTSRPETPADSSSPSAVDKTTVCVVETAAGVTTVISSAADTAAAVTFSAPIDTSLTTAAVVNNGICAEIE